MREILQVIGRSRDDEAPVFEKVLESAAWLCEAPLVFLSIVNEDRTQLSIPAHRGAGEAISEVWDGMSVALEGVEETPPVMPEGLAQARINPETGMLARLEEDDTIMEVFQVGRMPPMQETGQGEDQDVPLEEDPYEIY